MYKIKITLENGQEVLADSSLSFNEAILRQNELYREGFVGVIIN